MKKRTYHLLLTLICLLSVFSAQAQLFEIPLRQQGFPVESQKNNSVPSKTFKTQVNDTLVLPFFDDFSTYTDFSDQQFWQQKGGININNRNGINPPSKGVASFDG
ncbi:MAG: hypothetical protein H7Y04_00620, partial [Verrucomicrobia bacterium]|nr:hypothetical protein [Cytophagales bacterium]